MSRGRVGGGFGGRNVRIPFIFADSDAFSVCTHGTCSTTKLQSRMSGVMFASQIVRCN